MGGPSQLTENSNGFEFATPSVIAVYKTQLKGHDPLKSEYLDFWIILICYLSTHIDLQKAKLKVGEWALFLR